ncbi:MAG: conjugal transfer protein [Clostridiales bacterium]|nr:conjugal transfer protein [Clostridiales bacterium]
MQRTKWRLCPICGNKTRLQIREDTELKNFPIYCPKCKQETLINAKELHNGHQRAKRTDAEPMNL